MKKNIILFIFILNIIQLYSNSDCTNFIKNRNLLYVDTLYINGNPIIGSFIIDTGANISVIDKELSDSLKISGTIKNIGITDNMKKRTRLTTVKIDSINLAGETFFKSKFVIATLKSYSQELSGIIGGNILSQKKWLFDFENNCLSIINDSETVKDYNFKTNFKVQKKHPKINLKIDNKTIKNVILDTGDVNEITVLQSDSLKLREFSIDDKYHKLMIKSLFQSEPTFIRIKKSIFSSVRMNDEIEIDTVGILFLRSRTIGLDFFKKYKTVIFDYPDNTINFGKKRTESNKIRYNSLGCRFMINNENDIVVYSLEENSFAEKAGINLGDKLISWKGYNNLSEIKQAVKNNYIYKIESDTIKIQMEKWDKAKVIILKDRQ